MKPIHRALLSVSDKAGIVDFAQKLSKAGVSLLSTGGTYKTLIEAGLKVTEVAEYTGFPEIMDGRVKTLHPKIHGGILGRRGTDNAVMQQHSIEPIDMVVVNLYPFEESIANPNCTLEYAIENIDIGGPSMLRSAAKNHKDVAVISEPKYYASVLLEMENNQGCLSHNTRFNLAINTFAKTAEYDDAINNYLKNLNDIEKDKFPKTHNIKFIKKQNLRYGENPHQKAAFYVEKKSTEASISTAKQLQGKELSFNNIADTDSALELVKSLIQPACVIVKHANPCGVAIDENLLNAYKKAFSTDRTSAFGGILAFNRVLDCVTAKYILDNQFVEVIIAPNIEDGVSEIIANKKNVRLLIYGNFDRPQPDWDYKKVTGGLLVQDRDLGIITENDLQVVSKTTPTPEQIQDLLFAWKIAKFVKSNAIVYAKNQMTIGIGAGQMSRVYSAKIASIKAKDESLTLNGSVMASDAFFPFRDGIDAAAKVGIQAIIHPGGSIRDKEIIHASDEHSIAMVFTKMRHFKH